jgi:uncharacterized protein YkwD
MFSSIRIPAVFVSALFAAAALVAIMAIPGSTPAAYALTNCTVTGDTFDAQEREFLRLINQHRGSSRVPLTASVNLNRAAHWHADHMATPSKSDFSHTDDYGRSSGTRITQCDARPAGAGTGENIAAGTVKDTAAEVFAMWRSSSGHNANMLRPEFRMIGIARVYDENSYYKWYWVTDFITKYDGTDASTGGGTQPTPTPTPSTGGPASMTSPANGSQFSSSSVTFRWTDPTRAESYWLQVGYSVGGGAIYSRQFDGSVNMAYVTGLPTDGRNIYVRLFTYVDGAWVFKDYVYKAAP